MNTILDATGQIRRTKQQDKGVISFITTPESFLESMARIQPYQPMQTEAIIHEPHEEYFKNTETGFWQQRQFISPQKNDYYSVYACMPTQDALAIARKYLALVKDVNVAGIVAKADLRNNNKVMFVGQIMTLHDVLASWQFRTSYFQNS